MEGMEGLDGSEDNIIARLKNAWRNERFSPELLPSEQVLIDRVMQSVETQVQASNCFHQALISSHLM